MILNEKSSEQNRSSHRSHGFMLARNRKQAYMTLKYKYACKFSSFS